MGGGYTAMQDNTFANADNLIMSCTVLGIIILLNRIRIIWVKSSAILIALVIGYILAGFMGHLNFSVLQRCAINSNSQHSQCIWIKLFLELVYSNGILFIWSLL